MKFGRFYADPLHVRWLEAIKEMRSTGIYGAKAPADKAEEARMLHQAKCDHRFAQIGKAPSQCVHCGLQEAEHAQAAQALCVQAEIEEMFEGLA